MPYVPSPTIVGEYLNVEINETEFIEEYQVTLFNDCSSFELNSVGYEFTAEKTWKLNVSIPTNCIPGLYSLKVIFKVKNEVRETTQFKCVWLLDEWPENLVIAHLTDSHLPLGGGEVFERALYELNLLKPDVIVISGDIANRGNEELAWVRYRQLYNYSDTPIYIAPGNHDHYGRQEEKYYKRYGSPLYYYIIVGKFLMVFLDTDGDIPFIPESQLEWAESVLREYVDKVKIITFHHPLFVKGYEVTGSWRNVEALRDFMYPEWTTGLGINSAKKLLELIERCDVRLILSGHTHEEHYTLYNERHHFLVNLPAGGSTDEYPSYRFISIDSSGNVSILCRDNLFPYQHPSSYPIGKLTYYYTSFQNETSCSIAVKVSNCLDANITPTFKFILPANKPFKDYEFFPEKPDEMSLYGVNSQYIAYTKVKIPSQQEYYLIVTSFEDKKPPDVSYEYSLADFNTLKINISASDIGWGVKNVKTLYSLDGNVTWVPLDITLMLNEDDDPIKSEHSVLNYEGILAVPLNASSITLKVSAEDFANNTITKTYVFKLELEIRPHITIETDPKIAIYGSTVKILGNIGLNARLPVDVYALLNDNWIKIGSIGTTAYGKFALTWAPPQPGIYILKVNLRELEAPYSEALSTLYVFNKLDIGLYDILDRPVPRVRVIIKSERETKSIITDDEGRFTLIPELEEYQLDFYMNNEAIGAARILVNLKGVSIIGDQFNITLPPPISMRELTINLKVELYDLLIAIIDQEGRPMPNVDVVITISDKIQSMLVTNSSGLASLRQIPKGTYTITTSVGEAVAVVPEDKVVVLKAPSINWTSIVYVMAIAYLITVLGFVYYWKSKSKK